MAGPRTRVIPATACTWWAVIVEFLDMVDIRDQVRAMISEGRTLEEVMAAGPTAAYDARWGQEATWTANDFVPIVFHELGGGSLFVRDRRAAGRNACLRRSICRCRWCFLTDQEVTPVNEYSGFRLVRPHDVATASPSAAARPPKPSPNSTTASSSERRNGGSKIYARTFVQGRSRLKSTGERTVSAATRIATDWYLDLRDRMRKGETLHGRSFAEMAEAFCLHADQIREVSAGQRRNYRHKWHLLRDHFEGVKVTDVDAKFLLTLRETRSQAMTRNGTAVKPATLKKDMDFIRLVLRHARHIEKCLDELP